MVSQVSDPTVAAPRRVLVTGSSRGIGRAIAVALSDSGFVVTLHCRSNVALCESLADDIERRTNSRPLILQFDVRKRQDTQAKLDAHLEAHGAFYGMVLNAGSAADGPLVALSGEDWDAVIETNLGGFYNVVKPLLMPMIQLRAGGRIVAMSSVAGLSGHRGQVNYSAAKAGIIGATRSLAQEVAKRGITVNCVAPGFIDTDMTSQLPKEEILPHVPMRRFGTSEEVASLVAYLFSRGAAYLTGQTISVNGGLV